eukprot:PhM_4_TR17574/c0_g1_i1/m.46837
MSDQAATVNEESHHIGTKLASESMDAANVPLCDAHPEGPAMNPAVYALDPTTMSERPWTRRGVPLTDHFNYGLNEALFVAYARSKFKGGHAAMDAVGQPLGNSSAETTGTTGRAGVVRGGVVWPPQAPLIPSLIDGQLVMCPEGAMCRRPAGACPFAHSTSEVLTASDGVPVLSSKVPAPAPVVVAPTAADVSQSSNNIEGGAVPVRAQYQMAAPTTSAVSSGVDVHDGGMSVPPPKPTKPAGAGFRMLKKRVRDD